jgi:biopolymer transport protein ExbD/biopolymer transport protein TolR
MIDIMLVLLIIFMIVTPVISAGFQAKMPMGKNIEARPEESGDVVLGIDRAGQFYLDPGTGETGIVPEGQLETMLTQIYGARTTDKILYFKADQNLEFAKIQEGIDVARSAGVRVIAAITEELREERGGLFGGGAP